MNVSSIQKNQNSFCFLYFQINLLDSSQSETSLINYHSHKCEKIFHISILISQYSISQQMNHKQIVSNEKYICTCHTSQLFLHCSNNTQILCTLWKFQRHIKTCRDHRHEFLNKIRFPD